MHLLLICCFNPTLLDFAKFKVRVEGFVFLSELCLLTIGNIHQIYFISATHGVTLGEELLTVGMNAEKYVIRHFVSDLLHFTLEVGLIKIRTSVPNAAKVKRMVIFRPSKFIDTTFKTFCHIGLVASCKFVDAKTCAVTFITIALHAAPRDVFTIG